MVPRTFSLFFALLLAGACEVTPQDLETWKGTQRGPGKIVAVLIADKYPIPLRTQAAIALFEMNRSDTNAMQELQGALGQIAPVERAQIVSGMVVRVREVLLASAERPTDLAVRAKDAGYVIYGYTAGADQLVLQRALLDWVLADFNGRYLLGVNNTEKIVRGLGAPAAAALVAGITPAELAVEKICQLVMELGDPATKLAASAKLVETARAQAATPNGITEYVFLAMKAVGGRPIVDYILELASQDPPTEAQAASHHSASQLLGLAALEGHVGPQDADKLCDVALNGRLDLRVRDQAFDRIDNLKNPTSVARLWPLLDRDDKRLRWRAGELIMSIGGAATVPELFRKLPSGRNTEYLPEEIGGYGDRISEMNPVPLDAVRTSLTAESWVARLIAVQVIGRRGGRQDMPTLQQLTADNTRITGEGWDAGATVGKEARAALGRLQGGPGGAP
jgi:hypothetical protein